MTPEGVEAALSARTNMQQLASNQLAGDVLTNLRGRAFTIRTEFEKSARTVVYDVTVRLTEDPNQPYWLLDWRAK
jgi:general secretion pathway protein K